MITTDLLNQIDLFYGRMSSHAAHVYARMERTDQLEDVELTGTIIGPHCTHGSTLPAESCLVDRGPGETLLASTVIPDPCYWSPKLPIWYDVEVVLRRGQEVLGKRRSMLGLRMLGADERDLLWEGEQWRVDVACGYSPPLEELEKWSQERMALVVANPTDAYCREASIKGVWLFAVVSGNKQELRRQLNRLARWPSVAAAIIESEEKLDDAPRTWAPNLLLAQRFRKGGCFELADWAHVAICEVGQPEEIKRFALCGKPVLAWRTSGAAATPDGVRAACREFQQDLAAGAEIAGCDLAGYVV